MSIEQVLEVCLPLLVIGGFLAAVGKAIEEVIGESQHRAAQLWHRTRALHPIAVGMLLGYSELPIPESMGDGRAAHLIWYGLAGGLSTLIYELWRFALERKAEK